ncbi:MAG TPA: hypothetical protein VF391_05420 [Dermatophilaceae bacterium]
MSLRGNRKHAPPEEQRKEQADLTVPASLSVEHPKFQAAIPVPAELCAQLIVGLAAPA